MKWITAALFALWASVAGAQEDDIQAVINGQIAAFEADDYPLAFSFASRSIQQIFGTPDRFEAMVRGGYQMVIRPQDVSYLELRQEGGALWQKVLIRDEGGLLHVLDYQMIPTENGWRINGVRLVAPDEAA